MQMIKATAGPAILLFCAILPAWAAAQSYHVLPNGYTLSRHERPPVPPADIPSVGVARNNASAKHFPPLPRTRPNDIASGSTRETLPRAQGVTTTSRPESPIMVPVAPLE